MEDKTKRINTVDSEANVMTHKDEQKLPSYNNQSARDDKFGVVTAVQTNQRVDKPEDLIEFVDQSIRNTEGEHENIMADCSFSSYEILEEIENREESLYDKGREIYMKRQGLIEPMHGDDQKNKGWIQHHLRKLNKAKGEFLLIKITVNLGLIIRYRTKAVLT